MKNIEDKTVSELLRIDGKRVVVTGAAMGIGYAIVKRLAEAGANVLMTDINRIALEKGAQDLSEKGYAVKARVVDVGEEEDVKALFKDVKKNFGGIDILVNNAGIFPASNVVDMTLQELRNVLRVNTEGVFMCCREAGRQMTDQGQGGVVVNISSMCAFKPCAVGLSHYEASKGAVTNLTRSMALELASEKIRVVAVAPGGIWTEGNAAKFSLPGGDELLNKLSATIPLGGKFGHPDDIARTVLFLVSDAAAYITGTTIVVDGGATIS